ncbi:uncharacterized protein LOC127791227 [Diospyros lotus]|uniref:uncharacterized protein LOC127791227 n=1 Tax=Diospyros lotus TaxID=55363 RepID=UPI00225A50E3|nr:uncharacterized protein LOC127791227 [Diospyros lotus]
MCSRLFYLPQVSSSLPSISQQFSRQFSFPGRMSSHQTWGLMPSTGLGGETQRIHDDVSECPKDCEAPSSVYEEEWPTLSDSISSVPKGKKKIKIDLRTLHEQILQDRPGNTCPSQHEASPMTTVKTIEDQSLLPTSFGKKRPPSPTRGRHKHHQTQLEYFADAAKTDSNMGLPMHEPFDICNGSSILDASLNAENKEKEMGPKHSVEKPGEVIKPGMVLLTSFLTLDEQEMLVQIVKICRELGLGSGGFYQPGYKDGAKLRLMMMCLGLDWDPQTRAYRKQRGVDGTEPPGIPCKFKSLVKRALQVSHALIKKNMDVSNAEDILPNMSPDICIVNFYSTNGRLGLHQDRDESKDSLSKRLPVVSLSIGDSAEFLYGDRRDVDKADRVLLESGDMLVFGGDSRHIFHGVPSIIPNSAPTALLKATNLRAGRLNLTFRQY